MAIISAEGIPSEIKGLRLREADAMECLKGGLLPEEAITRSAAGSDEAWMVLADGVPVAFWGYSERSPLSGICDAWLLTTDDIEKYEYRFARSSLRIIADLLSRYVEVRVWVDLSHTVAVSWLAWLGFQEIDSNGVFADMAVTRKTALWVS